MSIFSIAIFLIFASQFYWLWRGFRFARRRIPQTGLRWAVIAVVLVAVSYTHLDVYKRQDQFFGQVKVEIREIHRTFRLAKRQVTEPWRASLAIPMVGYAFAEPAELLETACLRARLIVRC